MTSKRVIQWKSRTLDLSKPVVMGILNITPDSFYDGGKYMETQAAVDRAGDMIGQGAAIIDVGAVSTRPFSGPIDAENEWERLGSLIPELRKAFPETIISVDTYRAFIAEKSVAAGADMINDISGGETDEEMLPLVARLGVPYVLMHMQGTPQNMQINPQYGDVLEEVFDFFQRKLRQLELLGNHSPIILDPGFGFGKTLEHNYLLLNSLEKFTTLGCPVLAGISRKSMINKVLNVSSKDALNGSTVLNTLCLLNGADILRVHDVAEAVQAIELVTYSRQLRR